MPRIVVPARASPIGEYSRRWYLLFTIAACTALGLMISAQAYASEMTEGRSLNLRRILSSQLVYWELWVPLAPICFALVSRRERERWGPARAALVSLAAITLLSVLHTIAEIYVATAVGLVPRFAWTTVWLRLNATVVVNVLVLTGLSAAFVLTRHAEENRVRDLRSSQLEATLAEARLDALRAQLQPHFLFNSLHTVSALMGEDVDAARRVMARLGELLRFYLHENDAKEIPLMREMELASIYLEIQQIRFQERMSIEVHCDASASDALVPTMILQPVVENAVRHGIEAEDRKGMLHVTATVTRNRLVITVRDTGPGFRHTASAEGIGLSNTRARLEHLYGKNQALRVDDPPEGGCQVTIEMPFRRLALFNVES